MNETLAVRVLICFAAFIFGWRQFILGVRAIQDPQGGDQGKFIDGIIIAAICLVIIVLTIFVPSDWCSKWR